jgi:hypothetical protein
MNVNFVYMEVGGSRNISCMPGCRFNVLNVQLQKYIYYWSLEIIKSKICLLFTELNNEDKHIFRDSELRKQSANFKQTQRKQIIYFHVNRYIIWIHCSVSNLNFVLWRGGPEIFPACADVDSMC